MSNKKNRKHIYLVSGELTFSHPNSKEGEINSVLVNGIYTASEKQILLKDLNRIQQVLQLNFHKGGDGTELNVHNVTIQNVAYLAFASEEEFMAPPQGMKPVPMDQTAPPSFAADPEKTIEQAAAEAQQKQVDTDLNSAEAQYERA